MVIVKMEMVMRVIAIIFISVMIRLIARRSGDGDGDGDGDRDRDGDAGIWLNVDYHLNLCLLESINLCIELRVLSPLMLELCSQRVKLIRHVGRSRSLTTVLTAT